MRREDFRSIVSLAFAALAGCSLFNSIGDASVPRWAVGFFGFMLGMFIGMAAIEQVLKRWGQTIERWRGYIQTREAYFSDEAADDAKGQSGFAANFVLALLFISSFAIMAATVWDVVWLALLLAIPTVCLMYKWFLWRAPR